MPPTQLRLLLDSAVELREPLLEHVQGFTEAQRLHVPSQVGASRIESVNSLTSFLCQVMEVLYNVPPKESEAEEVGEGIETST